ncbi:MAG: hypothetical protein Q8Q97_00235, partial [bacterium]|nr:hypothetical protein [bacterium]
ETAEEAFDLLMKFKAGAEKALAEGRYDEKFAPSNPPESDFSGGKYWELQSSSATYRLRTEPYQEGDFSILYQGTTTDCPGGDVLVKISVKPADNALLEKESLLLKSFGDSKEKRLNGVGKFVPKILDDFWVPGNKGRRFRANVMPYNPEYFSLEEILRAHPKGLDPRDAAWIFRRIASQTIAAEMAGVVHGGMTPDHILVHPISHDPLHIGWAHSLSKGRRIAFISERWRDWYPPEVFEKKTPDFRTDLFMAAKTMVHIAGGNVKNNSMPSAMPKTVSAVVTKCLEKSPSRRPNKTREFLDDLTRAIRQEWGREYRLLVMPAR